MTTTNGNGNGNGRRRESEVRSQLEAQLFRLAREGAEGALRDVTSTLVSLIEDVEVRVAELEDLRFQTAQRVGVLEAQMQAIPHVSDLVAIHKLIFGDPQLGLMGLQAWMGEVRRDVAGVKLLVWMLMGFLLLLSVGVVGVVFLG